MKNTKPRKIRKPLTPIEKFTLFGPIIALLISGGLKAAGDVKLDDFNKEIKIDDTITQCEEILGFDNEQIKVSKLDEKGILSYSFDKNELLKDFKAAREIYLKYQHKPCISKEDKEEREKALDTIIESNDKIIELFNEVTKVSIASKLHTAPDQLEIYYNKPNEYAEPITTIKINHEEVAIGPELKELITKYKDGLLITYNKDVKNMPLSLKEETARKILENIKDYRNVLRDINDKDTTYIIYRSEPATDTDYLVYDNPKYDEELKNKYDIKPLPKVEFLNITIKKKDNEKNEDFSIKSSAEIASEER